MPSTNGVYSLPLGYLAVTGATIEASQHNPPLEDIALALTGRLSRDGTAAMSGAIQFAPGTVNAPGAVFSNDITTGFYSLGAGAGIGVAVGGVNVASFRPGGFGGMLLGMIVPYTCTALPALFVFPVGQTLSRTTYALLWAQAQIEIAAGNTFYNNGDGSTTFGIGDCRGRTIAAIDNMGGTDSARLNSAGSSIQANRLIIGGTGGAVAHALIGSEVPSITSSAVNSININNTAQQGVATTGSPGNVTFGNLGSGAGGALPLSASGSWSGVFNLTTNNNISVTSNNTGGGVHENMQPTILAQVILFAGA